MLVNLFEEETRYLERYLSRDGGSLLIKQAAAAQAASNQSSLSEGKSPDINLGDQPNTWGPYYTTFIFTLFGTTVFSFVMTALFTNGG